MRGALLVLVGCFVVGCSQGGDDGIPKVQGKVEEVKPPAGWTPPGDSRPAAAQSGGTNDSDSRG